ncbi:MAG: biotin--[acetyl-CoA-carboxylase] ligase [Cellulophaga sp.]
MKICKLNATDSTSLYLKELMLSEPLEDFTVVTAKKQLKGRGQMGTLWESEVASNLTFSVFKKLDALPVSNQFMISICVSIGIYKALKKLQIPEVSIKWPNDILSGNQKVCGVLIENVLSGNKIQASILGIGLNVNQINFENLPRATSLKLLMGESFNLDEVLHVVLDSIENQFSLLNMETEKEIRISYEKLLFRKGKPSTFKNKKGELFMGFISGISAEGKLVVTLEDGISSTFNLKEIELLY